MLMIFLSPFLVRLLYGSPDGSVWCSPLHRPPPGVWWRHTLSRWQRWVRQLLLWVRSISNTLVHPNTLQMLSKWSCRRSSDNVKLVTQQHRVHCRWCHHPRSLLSYLGKYCLRHEWIMNDSYVGTQLRNKVGKNCCSVKTTLFYCWFNVARCM